MTSLIAREPVLAATVTLILAVFGVLVAFGVELTDAQIHALRTLAEAALALAVLVRSKVTPGA